MEFHILELPKLPEELIGGSSDILLWAKFINAEQKEEFDMLAEKNPYIKSAYQHLQVISQDKQKRLEYEAREKAVRDYNQGMLEAEQRGKKEGLQEGRQEGREEGLQEGRQEGREEGRKEVHIHIAKNMLEKGFDKNTIIEITGLNRKEIDDLDSSPKGL